MTNFDIKFKKDGFQIKLEENGLFIIRFKESYMDEAITEEEAFSKLKELRIKMNW
jgi:hypothetical protein